MNQHKPPLGETNQYHTPNQYEQYWPQDNQLQHDLPKDNQLQNQSYNYTQYEQPIPEQQNRQFPGQQGGPSFGFPGGQPPGVGFPGQPGNQFPGNQGGQFPGQMPPFGGGGQSAGPPNSPPPSFTPAEQQIQPFAVDPGAIRGCLFRFTYIWLNRDQFWFFPTFVGRNSVAGFRWRRNRWVYFGIDLNRIQSFQCY